MFELEGMSLRSNSSAEDSCRKSSPSNASHFKMATEKRMTLAVLQLQPFINIHAHVYLSVYTYTYIYPFTHTYVYHSYIHKHAHMHT